MQALGAIRRRPTFWVEAAAAAAWAALAAGSVLAWGGGGATDGAAFAHGALWICTLGAQGASSASAHVGAASGGASLSAASLLAAAPMWALMAGAMMVPSALPAVRHVAVNSLYWRRRRAVVEFLLAYLGVWFAFSVFVLGALTLWAPAHSPIALPTALAVAALWQLTPYKWQALRACPRPRRRPPLGWLATTGTLRFGLLNGSACLASCWAIMTAVALTNSPALLWMAAATVLVYQEKLNLKPRKTARRVAVLLATTALAATAATLIV